MRFLIDECLSRVLVDALRRRGHDVKFIRDEAKGSDDVDVLAMATAENRLLISEDRDFGLLTVRNRTPAIGVIRVDVSEFRWPSIKLADHVADTLETMGDRCIGCLTTIEPGRVRQRKLT